MNGHFGLQAWNYIFLSVALKIGQIYFTTSDMDLTLSSAHKEERWKWVDESFVKEAEVIYRWLLKNPRDKDKVLCCSFEYLLSHVKDTPTSPLAPRFDDSPYLKKYLGKDYDIIIQGY